VLATISSSFIAVLAYNTSYLALISVSYLTLTNNIKLRAAQNGQLVLIYTLLLLAAAILPLLLPRGRIAHLD